MNNLGIFRLSRRLGVIGVLAFMALMNNAWVPAPIVSASSLNPGNAGPSLKLASLAPVAPASEPVAMLAGCSTGSISGTVTQSRKGLKSIAVMLVDGTGSNIVAADHKR